MLQLMLARRFGAVSLQISGTFLHTDLVIPGDQNDLFAIGGAVRLPLTKSGFYHFRLFSFIPLTVKVLMHGEARGPQL